MKRESEEKLRTVVFERLVAGENREELRGQLVQQLPEEQVDQLLSEAQARIESGRGSERFAREVRKIRKRRIVGPQFLIWRILGGVAIFLAVGSFLNALLSERPLIWSPMGLLVGGLIFAWAEWRENRIIAAKLKAAEAS